MLSDAAREICQGKIVYLLEGGYQLDALSLGAYNLVASLTGGKTEDPLGSAGLDESDVSKIIRDIRKIHGL